MLYAVFIFWVYGANTLSNDLYFISGYKPSLFWNICWHIVVIVALILTPTTMYRMIYYSSATKAQIHALIALIILFSLPILVAALYQYIKAVRQEDTMKMLKPDPSWGPPSEKLKKERAIFNPSKFIRHKEKNLKCYHRCLIRNPQLKELIKKSEETRRKFYEQLHRDIPGLQQRPISTSTF
ncbi:hypothetical protein L9F63_002015 [Diploptera punctata]|uniref:Uncharacterized protein n=1 Tax=Diploptera punctata TaxID=6984 RepID=A0AAD8A2N9_DIPPU|nr:hypothetical protein L9F63_002015 [Diploptera punctata]